MWMWYKQAISAMPINCKGINASGIHIPKSGIKYNQLIIVIRGEPISLVWPPLTGKRIKWFTDNQNVVSIVSKGSTKTVLQELALDIFSACLKFNVNIDMVWIAINAMPINCKGINASGIHNPKSGIKYNQLIIVIRGEPINLVWSPKGFNKFKYNIRYTPVAEKGNRSTWKELTAVKQGLLSVIHILSGKRITWFTYNQNVVSIVSKGSTKTVLQELTLDIFRTVPFFRN
jgi:hypothetical protein